MKSICSSLLYIGMMVGIVISSCSWGYTQSSGNETDVLPSGYVMKFERKGGYFGRHDAFCIYSDGRVSNSAGKTARIPSDLVKRWMKIISTVEVPIKKKLPSFQSLCMDCYIYIITVHVRGETKVLSSLCTDTYNLNKDENIPVIDFGQIRDTLMGLPWE